MRTVLSKLLLVVAVCLVPAVLGAWLRAREAQDDLVDEVRARLDLADEAFNGELKEDLDGIELTLDLVGEDPRLVDNLARGSTTDIRKLIASLSRGADDAAIAVADRSGRIVAASPGLTDSPTTKASLAQLARACEGEHIHTFLPFTIGGKQMFALTLAEPLLAEGKPAGALILARPIDTGFLDHARLPGTHWAVAVNGEPVAHSTGHPAPALAGKHDAVVEQGELGGRYYAMNSFKPDLLQRPEQVVVVTASRDLTSVRDEVGRDLRYSLALLGAALLLAVGLTWYLGRGMVIAIRRIGQAAQGLQSGQYTKVEGVKTGDELEQLATAFNQAVTGLRERDQLKETFGKYVTRHVAEKILEGKASLGGETVPVTVLFSDIRGFTTISEKMEPKALLDFLNLYFHDMVDSVLLQSGVVDKFIGDAIMAVFGAPVPQPDDAYRAVRSALDMRSRLRVLNERFAARGLPQLRIGIGIHSGTVVAGNMGHKDRMEYTVIGDPVNLASRLEGMTKELGVDILLSEDTYQKVKDQVNAEPLSRIKVRGREQEVMVYRLIGARDVAPQAAA